MRGEPAERVGVAYIIGMIGKRTAAASSRPSLDLSPCAPAVNPEGERGIGPVSSVNPNSCLGSRPNMQGRDTRTTGPPLIFVGIGVGKDWLDLWLEPSKRFERVSNDVAGWAAILDRLQLLGSKAGIRRERRLRTGATKSADHRRVFGAPAQSVAGAAPHRVVVSDAGASSHTWKMDLR